MTEPTIVLCSRISIPAREMLEQMKEAARPRRSFRQILESAIEAEWERVRTGQSVAAE